MVNTFRANLPTWHRYWEVRQRALGLEHIHVYDTRAALIESMPDIPFDQAVEWISAGMQPLGEEYVNILRQGVLHERWVDIYPNKGKRFGAFSSGGSSASRPSTIRNTRSARPTTSGSSELIRRMASPASASSWIIR